MLGLRAVLVQELEQLGSGVLVQGVGELGDSRGDLEALAEDDLLTLKADILGPLDEAGKVGLVLNVLTYATIRIEERKRKIHRHTDTEVLGGGLEERVLLGLSGLAGSEGSSSGLLSGSGLGFGRLVMETKLALRSLERVQCASEL